MKIYVYEHITGGGMRDQELPASLAREGDLMLNALVRDLSTLSNVKVIVSRDDRLQNSPFTDEVELVKVSENDSSYFMDCNESADAVWPIAPETDGILANVCQRVLQQNRILLNSRPNAVALAGSKFKTTEWLNHSGIPVIPTYHPDNLPRQARGPWVIKPDDGVGCEGARRFDTFEKLLEFTSSMDQPHAWVAQPFIVGESISVNALFCSGQARQLSCNYQHVEWQGSRPVLHGCTVNVDGLPVDALANRIEQIANCIPELWGIAGIDLMLTEEGPVVMEINPRLTTSYAGLNAALGINPAALVLELLEMQQLPQIPELTEMTHSIRVNLEIKDAA